MKETAKLERRLLQLVTKASLDHRLIEPGDRIMACLSGGKDSYTMLHLLRQIQRKVPFDFSIVAVNLDQKQPNFPEHILPAWLSSNDYEFRIIEEDTYSIVTDKVPEGKTYCSLCSRLRRGILYGAADELGANKLALGHHRDDLLETLLLNLFYSGQLKSMAPRLQADNGRHVVIRPLVYCVEAEIARFAEAMSFPIIPCDLCGSQEHLKRKQMKALVSELHAENPKVRGNMLAALSNVVPSHLLDRELMDRLRQPGDAPEPTRPDGWRGLDEEQPNTRRTSPFTILTDR
jgi:tRNA 2-thiocytidine biosynthesis protein TtcA